MNKIEFETAVFNQRILELKQGWADSSIVNICPFNSIFDNHSVSGVKSSREYKRIHKAHCLEFDGMSPELSIEIDRCFNHLITALDKKFKSKVFWYLLVRGKL